MTSLLWQKNKQMLFPTNCPRTFLNLPSQVSTDGAMIREFLSWKKDLVVGEDYWMAAQQWENRLRGMSNTLLKEMALLDLSTLSPNNQRKSERLINLVSHSYLYWWEKMNVAGPLYSGQMSSELKIEQEIIKDLLSYFKEGPEAQIISIYFSPLFPKDLLSFYSAPMSDIEKWSRSPVLGTALAPLWVELYFAKGEIDEANDYLLEMWSLFKRMKNYGLMISLIKYFEALPQSDLMILKRYLEENPWPKKEDQLTFWDHDWHPEIFRHLRPALQIDHDRMLSGVQYQVYRSYAENVESPVRAYALFRLIQLEVSGW